MIEIALAFAAGLLTAAAPCILPLLPVLLGASIASRSAAAAFPCRGFRPDLFRFCNPVRLVLDRAWLVARHLAEALRHPARQLWRSAAVAAAIRVADGEVERPALFGRQLRLARWIRQCRRPCCWTGARRALDTVRRAGAGSILTLIATSESLPRAALLLVIFAIGAGVPILLIAYGGQYATTQVRRLAPYTVALQRTFGVAVLLVAFAFYTQYDTIVAVWFSELYPNLQLGL